MLELEEYKRIELEEHKRIEELKKEGIQHALDFMEHIKKTLEFASTVKSPHGLKMVIDITKELSRAVEKSNEWLHKLIDEKVL